MRSMLLRQWGARYDLDLQATGRSAGVRDYGGQDIQTAYDLTGTIAGNGLELAVNERHTSSLVATTSLRTLPSQRGTASQANSTLASSDGQPFGEFFLEGGQAFVRTAERVIAMDAAPSGRN